MAGDPREPLLQAARRTIRAHVAEEGARLARVLTEAHTSGTSAHEALRRVLSEVRDGQSGWEDVLSSTFATASDEAGAALVRGFVRSGLLPRGTTYDAARTGSEVARLLASSQHSTAARALVDHTTRQLSASLSGQPVEDMLDTLRTHYTDWQAGRADLLADTQVLPGWNLGQLDAAFQAAHVTGSRVSRTWVATLDAHTRPEHAAADGQSVGLHEPFSVGGEQLMYPCDPSGSAANTINCRCSVDYALELATGASVDLPDMTDEEEGD